MTTSPPLADLAALHRHVKECRDGLHDAEQARDDKIRELLDMQIRPVAIRKVTGLSASRIDQIRRGGRQ